MPPLCFRRVLKYEWFDPATASPPEKSAPSPEILMEGPKPLDLDLMTDLKDVIFSSAPPANRHVSATCGLLHNYVTSCVMSLMCTFCEMFVVDCTCITSTTGFNRGFAR